MHIQPRNPSAGPDRATHTRLRHASPGLAPPPSLIVSLEAIFLSTFVMIGQNRQSAFQEAKADHDFTEQEMELKTNTELTREIVRLTTELNSRLLGQAQ